MMSKGHHGGSNSKDVGRHEISIIMVDNNFTQNTSTKKLLSPVNFSLDELKAYLKWRFVSDRSAAHQAGISLDRYHQIINGHDLPKRPEIIAKWAERWMIDPIKLTQCFERHDNKNREVTK